MQISNIIIQNYKSLKNLNFSLQRLSLVVGANASGKSNLSDCMDFISEVYRHGLEVAVGRKGGYENIAFRRTRRSKQPIKIELTVKLSENDWQTRHISINPKLKPFGVQIKHAFAFGAKSQAIGADFTVVYESLIVSTMRDNKSVDLIKFNRASDNKIEVDFEYDEIQERLFDKVESSQDLRLQMMGFPIYKNLKELIENTKISYTELIIPFLGMFGSIIYEFAQAMNSIRVIQLSPTKSREFGVPTPRPELDKTGSNLPAVVDILIKKYPKEWDLVLQTMRKILPDLTKIEVGYTTSRTLGLFFEEKGMGRPWSVDEISDGTIHTLGLLVSLFDPRSSALVVEEPENSVHPWIIRHILNACKQASEKKQIVITSHSPIVINSVSPRDVMVMWRKHGETEIKEIAEVDPSFTSMWESGEIPTFEYLDSGALPFAIPPTAINESDDLESE